jgi:hypothetical protein
MRSDRPNVFIGQNQVDGVADQLRVYSEYLEELFTLFNPEMSVCF